MSDIELHGHTQGWVRQCACPPWIGEIDHSQSVPKCTNCGREAAAYTVTTTGGTYVDTTLDSRYSQNGGGR